MAPWQCSPIASGKANPPAKKTWQCAKRARKESISRIVCVDEKMPWKLQSSNKWMQLEVRLAQTKTLRRYPKSLGAFLSFFPEFLRLTFQIPSWSEILWVDGDWKETKVMSQNHSMRITLQWHWCYPFALDWNVWEVHDPPDLLIMCCNYWRFVWSLVKPTHWGSMSNTAVGRPTEVSSALGFLFAALELLVEQMVGCWLNTRQWSRKEWPDILGGHTARMSIWSQDASSSLYTVHMTAKAVEHLSYSSPYGATRGGRSPAKMK